MERVVKFVKEKETKNTVRYKEVDGEDGRQNMIGSLYVQKWALGSSPPSRLRISLHPISDDDSDTD